MTCKMIFLKAALVVIIMGTVLMAGAFEEARLTLLEAWQDDGLLSLEIQADIPSGYALHPDDLNVQDTEYYEFLQSEFFHLQEKEVYGELQPVVAGEGNIIRLYLQSKPGITFPLAVEIMYQLCEDDICHMPVYETLLLSEDVISDEPAAVPGIMRAEDDLWNGLFTRAPIIIFLGLFGIGILSSLTPCIYPMIPITLGIIGVHGDNSLRKNLLRSFLFVTGITVSFSILGVISAFTGFIIGQWLGSIWFLLFITVLFVIMALSLFDFFTLQFPGSGRFNRQFKGGFISLIGLGLVSGFILSPCIGPVVVGILGLIAHTGSPVTGLLYMGVYGYGLGLPLIILGTFAGTLTRLPRSGFWMEEIKKLLGVLLYLVPLIFWYYYLSESGFYVLAAFFLFPLPFLTRYLKDYFSKEDNRGTLIKGVLSSLCILAALFFLLQGTLLMHSPVSGTVSVEEAKRLPWYSTVDEALPEAEERNVPVFVNVTAPWCAYCQIYKEYFQEPEIQEHLERYVLVELQFDREVGQEYNIMGIPQLLFLDPEGEELPGTRIVGLKSREEFINILKETFQQYESQGTSGF